MKRKPIFIVAIILVLLIATFLVFKTRKTGVDDYEMTDSDAKTSSDVINFTPIRPGNGIPYKAMSSTGINNTNLYWAQESVVDGADGCVLYDSTSKHIYASRYLSGGQTGSVETDTTYYTNELVSKSKAISVLDKYCFKG